MGETVKEYFKRCIKPVAIILSVIFIIWVGGHDWVLERSMENASITLFAALVVAFTAAED